MKESNITLPLSSIPAYMSQRRRVTPISALQEKLGRWQRMAAGNPGAFDDRGGLQRLLWRISESCPRARYHRPTHPHSLRLAFINLTDL
jgi:hypothetical protein